jgi:hypothetical protein
LQYCIQSNGAFRGDGTGIARQILQFYELHKISRGLKNVTYVFLLTSCIIWTVQEIQEENDCGRNCNGAELGKKKLFEHVDALLVSGNGWDYV